MARYYRVLKDTPAWEAGAIISNEKCVDKYEAIDPAFMRHEDFEDSTDGRLFVEHDVNKDFYERVYKVDLVAGKAKYLSKTAAKAALSAMHPGKDQ